MITTFITGIIAAILSFFGIPPGPYVAGVWIGVKILVVAATLYLAYRMRKKKKAAEAAEAAKLAAAPPIPAPAPDEAAQ